MRGQARVPVGLGVLHDELKCGGRSESHERRHCISSQLFNLPFSRKIDVLLTRDHQHTPDCEALLYSPA
jgi:hypothetical protein